MKHAKLLLLFVPFLLCSCGTNNPVDEEHKPVDSSGNDNPPVIDPPDTYVKDELENPIALGGMLPIGNKVINGPSNIATPNDIANGKTYSTYSALPTNWSFIMGNNIVNSGANFYSEQAGGGLKFSKEYYGLQSSAFTPYKYVSIKFKVSSVNPAKGTVTDSDIFHVYGYDKDNNCILQKNIAQGSITVQTKGCYVEVNIQNNEMTYFEIRLNTMPAKGSQCYNIGVSEFIVKGNN